MTSSGISSASTSSLIGSALPPKVVRVFGDVRFRIEGELLALCYAPDGSAWSVEESGILRHWAADTGRQLAQHELSDLEVIWTFSPDTRLLASGSDSLCLWDVASGKLLTTLAQPSWVTAQAFRGDGQLLATGHDDGKVLLWDLANGKLRTELAGHARPISALAFSKDGRRLATAAEDKIICLWDIDTGQELGQLAGHTDRIQALAWHPQGHRLVSAGWDTTARVWDTDSYEPVILLNGHGDVVSALAFSPDGKVLASADSNYVVWLWDPAAAKPLCLLHGHTGEINCLAFRPDGKHLLTGGQDRQLILWEMPSGRNLSETADQHQEAARISVSPDGKRLACVTGSAPVRVWDTSTGDDVLEINHSDSVFAVAFSPDGQWLATGDSMSIVRLWQSSDGRLRKMLEGHHAGVTCLDFSPDGKILASGGGTDGYCYLWSMANFEPLLLIPEATDNSTVETLGFCPGTDLIVTGGVDWLSTGGSDGAICLWDYVSRKPIAALSGGTTRLVVRSDGRQLAATTLSGSICLWDLPEPSMTKELRSPEGMVVCVAYDPAGRLLAAGCDDQTVRLWRTDTGELVTTFELDTHVRDLKFSPDGRWLYTANANTTCYMLEMPA